MSSTKYSLLIRSFPIRSFLIRHNHNHNCDYHGYISIDPRNTVTEFSDYKIENKVGQIYFGPGQREHRVVCLDEFSDTRLTIGFDISLDLISENGCLGMLPVL